MALSSAPHAQDLNKIHLSMAAKNARQFDPSNPECDFLSRTNIKSSEFWAKTSDKFAGLERISNLLSIEFFYSPGNPPSKRSAKYKLFD